MFQIQYGLGGGFGTSEWENLGEGTTEQEANNYAYESACQDYDSYAGLHGIRTECEIMEEDGVDEESAWEAYQDDRESQINYAVREI